MRVLAQRLELTTVQLREAKSRAIDHPIHEHSQEIMSRLDSFIRRLEAQRAASTTRSPHRRRARPVLELGLGNGRTYDHLRELQGSAHLRLRAPGRRPSRLHSAGRGLFLGEVIEKSAARGSACRPGRSAPAQRSRLRRQAGDEEALRTDRPGFARCAGERRHPGQRPAGGNRGAAGPDGARHGAQPLLRLSRDLESQPPAAITRFSFPAKAGTQGGRAPCFSWTPAFAGEEI